MSAAAACLHTRTITAHDAHGLSSAAYGCSLDAYGCRCAACDFDLCQQCAGPESEPAFGAVGADGSPIRMAWQDRSRRDRTPVRTLSPVRRVPENVPGGTRRDMRREIGSEIEEGGEIAPVQPAPEQKQHAEVEGCASEEKEGGAEVNRARPTVVRLQVHEPAAALTTTQQARLLAALDEIRRSKQVTASTAHGHSLHCTWSQPPLHVVTASAANGHSFYCIWSQP